MSTAMAHALLKANIATQEDVDRLHRQEVIRQEAHRKRLDQVRDHRNALVILRDNIVRYGVLHAHKDELLTSSLCIELYAALNAFLEITYALARTRKLPFQKEDALYIKILKLSRTLVESISLTLLNDTSKAAQARTCTREEIDSLHKALVDTMDKLLEPLKGHRSGLTAALESCITGLQMAKAVSHFREEWKNIEAIDALPQELAGMKASA